ncbi:MAG: trimethylamine methyltransferase family protein [Gammaproteobacteria bacterium]|nr:trimethylamine methyltransferase family protein [Gammaproteobacteria bacterium]
MSREEGRRGGRQARRKLRTATPVVCMPTLVPEIPLYEILDGEGIELIHNASMDILENPGIDFRDDEAVALWKAAGVDVDGYRVRIDRDMLLDLVSKTPSSYTMNARNPKRSVKVGGRNTIFVPTYGSPYVRDLSDNRRYSTLEDLHNFHKLAYLTPSLHMTGGITCEPTDVAVSKRHLRIAYSLLKHSDKPFMGATTARERAEDTVEMAKIVFGEDYLRDHTVMTSVINCNSPLVWDATMLDALKVYARNNQAVLCSPFVLAGASTPASTLGAVAQLNAEALAGIAFGQLVQPGSPMVYGQFLATVSMKSGAPMAGTPEIAQMNFIIGQLARKYNLPWRSSGMVAGSKVVDAQAAYESNMTMFAVVLSGANYVFHAAGWNEAGLCASYAKFVLDAEQVAMFYKFAQGVSFDDFDEAIAAVREVGPGGHYLGTTHTQEHFETAFFMPELLDNNNYEQWVIDGATDANTRGLNTARAMLERYEEPQLDIAVDEGLRDFIAKREAVLPDEVS